MARVFPFRALRPRAELAASIAAVPYDVVDRDEARRLAQGAPHSFLHVTKPEIDLSDDVDPSSNAVYERGAHALRAMIEAGDLRQDTEAHYYLYALTMTGHTQWGLVLCASVDDYRRNLVRKHEHTRPDKEDDRARHIEILAAQTGIVFLLHRSSAALEGVVESLRNTPPEVNFVAVDGIRHQVWIVPTALTQTITDGFAALGPIYIADGHHRSAAAARVAARRGTRVAGFVAVSFPVNEVRILPYNRVVRDLRGRSPSDFLRALGERFTVTAGRQALQPRRFAMFLQDRWHTLDAPNVLYQQPDPVARLDVSVLQEHVLAPLLGITDPRRDKRIDFVGGIRGDTELERRVREGWAVAFSLHPTAVSDLLAIADAEAVMPPKSTWFEPKLRDGLFVNLL